MNERIQQAIDLTKQVLGDARKAGKNVCCSVSGGADSDILIDLCERAEPHFVSYVFFDTALSITRLRNILNILNRSTASRYTERKRKCLYL